MNFPVRGLAFLVTPLYNTYERIFQLEDNHTVMLLDTIDGPKQLRALSFAQMRQLAEEIRYEIIHKVAAHGGHLAPNLGVVELTMALHYAFDTPRDLLVWGVSNA